jgi:hypothetical protein
MKALLSRRTGRSARSSTLGRPLALAATLASCALALLTAFAPATAQAIPPSNLTPPTISGGSGPVEGETLTGTDGTWDGESLTFDYQWQRSDGLAGWDNVGTNTNTYALTSADVGQRIRLQVIASNAEGQTEAFSDATNVVDRPPPTLISPPTIIGGNDPDEGQALTGTDGTWNHADSFSYQWERSSDSGFVEIDGATANTYVPTAADVGETLRLRVIASNAGGDSLPAFSAATSVVDPAPPTLESGPTISGTPVEGNMLIGDAGTWNSSASLTFSYQWQRSSGSDYVNIGGADGSRYELTSADVGKTIRLRVTASNLGGTSGPAFSEPTATVLEPPVHFLDLFVARRPSAFKRATIRAAGFSDPALRLWVYEDLRGKTCAASPAERSRRTRMVIDGEQVGGDFSEERRPRMKRPGRRAFCAYVGANADSAEATSFTTRKVRKPFLSSKRARETVEQALLRHGFATRVVQHVRHNCARRGRSMFECGFRSRFFGYSLSGHGSVELKRKLSYRFTVSTKGRSFTLTDENEGRLPAN